MQRECSAPWDADALAASRLTSRRRRRRAAVSLTAAEHATTDAGTLAAHITGVATALMRALDHHLRAPPRSPTSLPLPANARRRRPPFWFFLFCL
jgi:hypothetical protein